MNVRRRWIIRNLLDQLLPFEEQEAGEGIASKRGFSLVEYLRHWQEAPAFLETFERFWNSLPNPEASTEGSEPSRAFRIFTPDEEQLLTTEARGYLLNLLSTEVLSPAQLETVIENAFECWVDEVTIDLTRLLVAVVLMHEAFGADGSFEEDTTPSSLELH